jgi:hypothetical protein
MFISQSDPDFENTIAIVIPIENQSGSIGIRFSWHDRIAIVPAKPDCDFFAGISIPVCRNCLAVPASQTGSQLKTGYGTISPIAIEILKVLHVVFSTVNSPS